MGLQKVGRTSGNGACKLWTSKIAAHATLGDSWGDRTGVHKVRKMTWLPSGQRLGERDRECAKERALCHTMQNVLRNGQATDFTPTLE